MLKPAKKHRTDCPVAFALDAVGDRWTMLIIRDIILRGSETYGEFLDAGESIATNILADRLRDMEASGVLTKTRDPENHRRNIYRLTAKGWDLAPIVIEMVLWGAKYDPDTIARKTIIARIKKDRKGFIADLKARAT